MSQHYRNDLDCRLPHVLKLETFNQAAGCSLYSENAFKRTERDSQRKQLDFQSDFM